MIRITCLCRRPSWALCFGILLLVAAKAPPALALRRGVHRRSATLETVAAAALPHLNYYGGAVLANVQVYSVFWGPNVDPTVRANIGAFYGTFTGGAMFDWLGEYDTTIRAQNGRQGTNQLVGHGSYAGTITITPAHTSSRLTDADIQAELLAQINAKALPAPSADTLFMVHFPPGVQITLSDGTQSCARGGFCAFHDTIARSPQNVFYGAIPDQGPGSGCDSGCGSDATMFNNLTSVASHELIEAVTDPEVGLGPAVGIGPPLAWYDTTNGEIGDICNGTQGRLDGYVVQLEWSNQQGRCQLAGPGTPLPTRTRTPTATAAASFTPSLTATPTQTLVPGAPTWTSTATPTQTTTPPPTGTPTMTATLGAVTACTDIAPTNPCAPGGGPARTDCNIEWQVSPVPPLTRRGIPGNRLICSDGDPNCDFDADPANHSCTFHVALCLNNNDVRLTTCQPLDVDTFEVRGPNPLSAVPADQANLATLENQAGNGFGLTVVRRGSIVSFGSGNATNDQCSGRLDIIVPLRDLGGGSYGTGRTKLKIETVSSDGQRDVDSLALRCKPAL